MLQQQYAPRGSNLYYVLRKVPKAKQEFYLALSAFALELNYAAEQYREVAVAEKKLAWWYEEVERFFIGKSAHPLLQALFPVQERLSKTAMQALVEANLLSLKTHVFETRNELWQHYQHLGGIRLALLSALFNTQSSHVEIHLHELGIVDEILRHLCGIREFLVRQHLYFAMEDFQHQKIDPAPILQLKQLATLAPLCEEYFQFAKQQYQTIPFVLKPLQLEVLLKLKQAELMRRDTWKFFTHQVELSPIRKLWLTTF